MPYRNLTFRSLATNIRTESYLGEDHIVIPCIALVGDEVVYGMNAEGPEFIPAEELEFSTLGWSGRPVLYDHPANSTSTANEPATLQAMSFGQIFYPRFEDNKLKVEAWCNKRRALEIGQGELIESIERGEVIELSVGAIISIEKRNGIAPNGKSYTAIWHDVQSDHLAIGLSGSQGACNIEMGCGANRLMSSGKKESNPPPTFPRPPAPNGPPPIPNSDYRTMRAMRGEVDMPTTDQPKPTPESSTAEAPSSKPQTRIQKILSYASRIFRSNTEDEGLSDFDLRSRLWDVLYSIEPAFIGIEDVYQDSQTVRYITHPSYPESKMYLWRRTYTVAEDGAVTVNDDREEIDFAVNYIYLANGSNATNEPTPCGCQSGSTARLASANEIDNGGDDPKEDTDMADDKTKTDATPPATPTNPAAPSTPAQPATEDTPKSPDTQTPAVPATPATPAVTNEQLKALLEEHPVVKHYRAQEAKERATLISALTKKQKVLTEAQLNEKSIEDLRTIADLVGFSPATVNASDFSGRMMADATDDDVEIKPVPNVWEEARKLRAQKKTGAAG